MGDTEATRDGTFLPCPAGTWPLPAHARWPGSSGCHFRSAAARQEPQSSTAQHPALEKQLRTLASSGQAQVALNTNTVTCVHSHV